MSKFITQRFPNWGLFLIDFKKKELMPLIEEVESIKLDPQNAIDYSDKLVGQIYEQYKITESINFLNDLLLPYAHDYSLEFDFYKSYTVLRKNAKVSLGDAWVNFQKKYEFNPLHNHSGLFSFVIWLEVPYDIEIEKQVHPGRNSSVGLEGAFNLHFINTMGNIETHRITIDKSMLYKCIVFPSKFYHSVYPFYSSDGTRISVSGNFYFDN